MRCGGIVSDSIITNFPLIPTVKKCENWSLFDEIIRRTKSVPNFLDHSVSVRCLCLCHDLYRLVTCSCIFNCFNIRWLIYYVLDASFDISQPNTELHFGDTVLLNCRVRRNGYLHLNLTVEILDDIGQRLKFDEHTLLNNVSVVQTDATVSSSTLNPSCIVSVLSFTPMSRTLSITQHPVLGELC